MKDFRIVNFHEPMLPAQPRSSEREHFVMIPLSWVRAANLAGRAALSVGAMIHYRQKVYGESPVVVSNMLAAHFGLSRKAKATGLKQLLEADLIEIISVKGRSPRVTLRQLRPDGHGSGNPRIAYQSKGGQDAE